ncbi:superoxide dismutase [Cu-Zn] SodC [Pelomonas sp. CA6]|uniref:superoxide dismutase [Cu-Zn] SodC n=1 Tax=Pelomonas sp. CA6 TaxID=2907999 RepID=UPI001F4B821C|nr:superoxide dismutase [Cu-Zn] SodC [Pelomonas sp. CA6]MCH7342831.1 superoxide dismutase [Cu-Zn] SodC [Pelomonas sp. CA6]
MKRLLLILSLAATGAAAAAELTVPMQRAEPSGPGAELGSVRLVETPYGLALYPRLTGLAPGLHGFHFHAKPSCAPAEQNGSMVAALGAGGHLDPRGANKHGEPWGDGHLGDLPPLFVSADGEATTPVLAPRLKLADVIGHALMVHAGGDNHADHPAPLGGGGARVACGVVTSN